MIHTECLYVIWIFSTKSTNAKILHWLHRRCVLYIEGGRGLWETDYSSVGAGCDGGLDKGQDVGLDVSKGLVVCRACGLLASSLLRVSWKANCHTVSLLVGSLIIIPPVLWIGMCACVHLKIEESKSIDEDYISLETIIFSLSRSHLKNKNKEKNKNKRVLRKYIIK